MRATLEALNRDSRKKVLKGGEEKSIQFDMVPPGVSGREQRESILLDPSPALSLATSGMMTGGPHR